MARIELEGKRRPGLGVAVQGHRLGAQRAGPSRRRTLFRCAAPSSFFWPPRAVLKRVDGGQGATSNRARRISRQATIVVNSTQSPRSASAANGMTLAETVRGRDDGE